MEEIDKTKEYQKKQMKRLNGSYSDPTRPKQKYRNITLRDHIENNQISKVYHTSTKLRGHHPDIDNNLNQDLKNNNIYQIFIKLNFPGG